MDASLLHRAEAALADARPLALPPEAPLQQQLDETEELERGLRKALRKIDHNHRMRSVRAAATAKTAHPIPGVHQAAVKHFCHILFHTNWNWACAAAFLEAWQRKNRGRRITTHITKTDAKQYFCSIPSSLVEKVMDEHLSHPPTPAVKRARSTVFQWRMATFVRDCNAKGSTPTSYHLSTEIARLTSEPNIDDDTRCVAEHFLDPGPRRRWKRRWSIGYGQLQTAPKLTQAELQSKACSHSTSSHSPRHDAHWGITGSTPPSLPHLKCAPCPPSSLPRDTLEWSSTSPPEPTPPAPRKGPQQAPRKGTPD